jgi:hypothetical protein
MRRQLQQPPALEARLEDEMKMAVLEVTKPAVHESRRSARRTTREVIALDERHAQATQCRIASDADARDSATDHEHVESSRAKIGERVRALCQRDR